MSAEPRICQGNMVAPADSRNASSMREFTEGDQVQIDIPDSVDPDHHQYHGDVGGIVFLMEDDAGEYICRFCESYSLEV